MTPEYIALCREAKLPHRIQVGDWCAIHNPALSTRKTALYLEDGARFGNAPRQLEDPERDLFWLPREGDWLDLLEAEDVVDVTIGIDFDTRNGPSPLPDEDCSHYAMTQDRTASAADRLTALARLYAAVTESDSR